MTKQVHFPLGFVWGAATASYQIEGGWDEDGRGESVWDRFAHTPGNVAEGHTGDVACDHYHRWQEDIAIMKRIGLQAYRLSVAWPRILPDGRGRVNPAGLDFYSRLVDGLLEAGITPFVTLFHWDLPQVLQDEGGWANRAVVDDFVAFTDLVTAHLGDRVKHWITHNEPSVVAFVGHEMGSHAPGLKDLPTALRVAHHLLLSHGRALPVIRRNVPGAQVGITLNINYAQPASPSAADYHAMRRGAGQWTRWFTDPLYGRHYPADLVADFVREGVLPGGGPDFLQPGDYAEIAAPTDFLGVNYYTRQIARSNIPEAENLPRTVFPAPVTPTTYQDFPDWEIYPEGLRQVLCWLYFNYQVPAMYITENGASFGDGPDASGRIADQRRVNYLRDHFAAAAQAMAAGVPLKGYFVWSLLDNFEWGYGYTQRFGLVWVDYQTQQRLLKDSALWYSRVIQDNGFGLA
jgi:beta-glucosidase